MLDAQRPDRRLQRRRPTPTRNGYVDDIAGWDFFDDDNDPYDASSYSSADNHGSGRAAEAGEEGNDGAGGIGVCPRCQIVPLRVWDTFVVDTNNFAQAVLYAADNGIEVVEGAVGGLFNSRFARARLRVRVPARASFFAIVSSDLNTADHNIPTLYDEAMQVQGTRRRRAGPRPERAAEVQRLPQRPRHPRPTRRSAPGSATPAPPSTAATRTSSCRPSPARRPPGRRRAPPGCVVVLRPPAARRAARAERDQAAAHDDRRGRGRARTPPASASPDPAQVGLGPALRLRPARPRPRAASGSTQGKIPPQALITVARLVRAAQPRAPERASQISGPAVAPSARRATTGQLQWAPGIEPAEADFRTSRTAAARARRSTGRSGRSTCNAVRAALDARAGGGADRPTRRARRRARATRTRTSRRSPCASS